MTEKIKHYDYIIAGAGCAGLSFAFYLNRSELKEKKILIIDKEKKNENDRTWCFWEKTNSDFESIVYKKWFKLDFFSSLFNSTLNFNPFEYKMIRGIDYYQFVTNELYQNTNIDFLIGEILQINNEAEQAEIIVNDQIFYADWIFNSIYKPENLNLKKGRHFLLQHFKGWEIETESPFFNSEKATFMDFRIEQHNECRFFYVLPTSNQRALIEFTVFSKELLPGEEYDKQLKNYISDYLKIENYKILHQEFGVIPMTDAVFTQDKNSRVIDIGTASGRVKASSGYAFLRIHQHSKKIVDSLAKTGKPILNNNKYNRFKLYDSILLNIISENLFASSDIFTDLFRKNSTSKILLFLNEETDIKQDLEIMSTTYYPPFIKALLNIITKRL